MRSTPDATTTIAARFVCVVGAAMALMTMAGCERAKTRLDREVDRLCAIDGGVHIYETVKLPKENFSADGTVFPEFRQLPIGSGRFGPEYRVQRTEEVLITGDPVLVKSRTALIRTRDSKVLGEMVNYSRRGGDLPGPWHGTAKSCLDVLPDNSSIERLVFLVAADGEK